MSMKKQIKKVLGDGFVETRPAQDKPKKPEATFVCERSEGDGDETSSCDDMPYWVDNSGDGFLCVRVLVYPSNENGETATPTEPASAAYTDVAILIEGESSATFSRFGTAVSDALKAAEKNMVGDKMAYYGLQLMEIDERGCPVSGGRFGHAAKPTRIKCRKGENPLRLVQAIVDEVNPD